MARVWVAVNDAGMVVIPRAFRTREIGEEWLEVYRVLNPDAPPVELTEQDISEDRMRPVPGLIPVTPVTPDTLDEWVERR